MSDMRLIVAGAGGRMGRTLVHAIAAADGVTLVGAVDAPGSAVIGRDAGEIAGLGRNGVEVGAAVPGVVLAALPNLAHQLVVLALGDLVVSHVERFGDLHLVLEFLGVAFLCGGRLPHQELARRDEGQLHAEGVGVILARRHFGGTGGGGSQGEENEGAGHGVPPRSGANVRMSRLPCCTERPASLPLPRRCANVR